MSESEAGLVTSREAYGGLGLQNSPSRQPQPMVHNMNSVGMRMPFPEGAVYKPAAAATPSSPHGYQPPGNGTGDASPMAIVTMNMVGSGEATMKRKRGRPRKYGPDGNMSLSLDFANPVSAGPAFSLSPSGGSMSPCSTKKARGRPPGSGRKLQMAAGGSGFTPHVITLRAGEDVSSKIMSFLHHGHRSVCILSANGTLSNVTLKHPATSGGTISYESHDAVQGRFEILSLSGSYLLTESDGQRRISGGLSVCLAGPDGRILGGGVTGALVAASPVQVIAGSFIEQSCKEAQVSHATQLMNVPPPNLTPTGAHTSRGTVSESSAGPPSNLSHNSSNPQAMPCRGNEVTKIMTITSSPESQNLLMALDSIQRSPRCN